MNVSGKQVLILGSGRSALEFSRIEFGDFTIVCINNAWQCVDGPYDYWFHAGDFPRCNFPPRTEAKWITTSQADLSVQRLKTQFADLHISDLTFPKCVCWTIDCLAPQSVGFLGCDHDYEVQSTERWLAAKQPGPQNNWVGFGEPQIPIEIRREERRQSLLKYGKASAQELQKWSNEFFADLPATHFYGHGTPDPMRVGTESLLKNFHSLAGLAKQVGVELCNYSSCEESLLPFPRSIV